MKNISLSKPVLSKKTIDNLTECIDTGWVSTGGRFISEFESLTADYVKMSDAVSVQSGTAGLHIALRLLGVGQDDEVIAPTLTFIAAVNPIRYMGAEPVFMDCDDSLCIDPDKLGKFCEEECFIEGEHLVNKTTKKRIKAIVVVHVFGNMANMDKIMDIAAKYKLKVLEDATEALGTYYTDGLYKGLFAGTVGDIGVYSFNANKIITTGGGGMLVSKNKAYIEKARYLSTTAKDDALYFVHDDVGYNYRMLNLQAALGVEQIKDLEDFIAIKESNYKYYNEYLDDGFQLIEFKANIRPNYWFYSILSEQRDNMLNTLIDKGVGARPLWKLNHKQKPYMTNQAYKIEKALEYERILLNVPCSVDLTHDDIEYICDIINKF